MAAVRAVAKAMAKEEDAAEKERRSKNLVTTVTVVLPLRQAKVRSAGTVMNTDTLRVNARRRRKTSLRERTRTKVLAPSPRSSSHTMCKCLNVYTKG